MLRVRSTAFCWAFCLAAAAACGDRDRTQMRPGAPALPGARVASSPATPPPAADPPSCLRYEPQKAELRGTLTRVRRYGPPNYGEDTLHDEPLVIHILRLDTAIAVCGDHEDTPESETETGVREVQLMGPRTPLHRSGRMVVYGGLFHAIWGTHFTRVLIMVDSVRPEPGS